MIYYNSLILKGGEYIVTRQDLQRELVSIIILARNVGDPFVRGRMLSEHINKLCDELNL
jgi:hypothetical protein